MKITVGLLLRATLTPLLMLMAMAGAAVAGPFEVTALQLSRFAAAARDSTTHLPFSRPFFMAAGLPRLSAAGALFGAARYRAMQGAERPC
jgi:hypothetical protein